MSEPEYSSRMDGRVIAYQVLDCPARRTAVVHATLKTNELPAFFSRALTGVLEAMEAQGAVPAGEPFAYYHGIDDGTIDVEAGFPTLATLKPSGEVVPGELPGGKAVIGVHLGPYDTLSRTYADMRAWAVSEGMRPTDDMWEVYLTDPERELDPNRWRTGVFLRVE